MILKRDLTQLLNMARLTLVGASNVGMKAVLYDVLSEFFRDTSAWYEVIPFSAIPNKWDYPVAATDGQIIRLAAVYHDEYGSWPAVMPCVGTVHISRPVNNSLTLNAVVTKTVSLPTTKDMVPMAPDWVIPRYHLTLLDGLLSKMMLQPNKSYSNPAEGALLGKRWRDGLTQVRVEVLRANTAGTQAWRFPQSFRLRNQRYGVPSFGGERTF